jgi:hypothetical protein
MHNINRLTRFGGRAFCISQQIEQPDATLQLKPALVIHGADDGHLL